MERPQPLPPIRFRKELRRLDGEYAVMRHDQVELPNGALSVYEWLPRADAVMVAATLPDGRIIFTREWRYPIQAEAWSLPAGSTHAGEDLRAAAMRELEEETGYTAAELTLLGSPSTSPGLTPERIHLYRAGALTEGQPHCDPEEFIAVELVEPEQLPELLAAGLIPVSSVAALFLARLWPES